MCIVYINYVIYRLFLFLKLFNVLKCIYFIIKLFIFQNMFVNNHYYQVLMNATVHIKLLIIKNDTNIF